MDYVAAGTGLAEKVAFLRRPESYRHDPASVEVVESHMAWVFLAGSEVYKLKKPVRRGFLDFATLEARRHDCEEEVRLNRRLAREVYLGVAGLRRTPAGDLTLDRDGDVVEWLVHMRRLPRARMLDARIEADDVEPGEIRRLMKRLVTFYSEAERIPLGPEEYVDRFRHDVAESLEELNVMARELPPDRAEVIARGLLQFLSRHSSLFHLRARAGNIVEGHGDLRPEHVGLLPEPLVIDCLEFNRDLRTLDPADDLAFLATECARLGAAEIGDAILSDYQELSGDRPPYPLVAFYKSFRSYVRAKIAIWHLMDDAILDHDKWIRRARTHLDLALAFLPAP